MLSTRYITVPFYIILATYLFRILYDFIKVAGGVLEMEKVMDTTMQALTLLDITMIANLVWLIAAGSYYVFVAGSKSTPKEERPLCLQHVSAGLLKEKMAGSLIGVSSVHLLKLFLDVSKLNTEGKTVNWLNITVLAGIHVLLILGLSVFNKCNAADHHDHTEVQHKPEEAHA